MRAVNLLPRESSDAHGLDRVLAVAVGFTVLVAAILAGAFFLEKAHASNEKQRLANVQAELATAQSQQPITHSAAPAQLQIPVVLSQEEPWHVALHSAISTRVAWDVFLKQLEYVVPDRVSVTNVTLGSAGAGAGATSGTITLGGNAFSAQDVAVFLSTLARVPKISNVTLVSSTASAGKPIMTFQISAQMAIPAPPAPPATDTTDTTTTPGGSA
jgi:Tfp pilus assembly protein PilN